MEENDLRKLESIFAQVQDPRKERTRLHRLRDIIILAICGVLCGAEGWVEIEEFGKAKEAFFTDLLTLVNGIPSHDTFGRVFALIDAELVGHALQMALARRCPQAGVLHHSDRGSTYTSESYLLLLRQNDITMSMSRTANCYDNAVTESFFHSFKGECIELETFYNRTCRHSTLQYMSPVQFEQLMC